jgi:hypothetical protein
MRMESKYSDEHHDQESEPDVEEIPVASAPTHGEKYDTIASSAQPIHTTFTQ